jgi:fumarate reductase subunit D
MKRTSLCKYTMSITNAETKIGKAIYAVVVILFAIAFPLILLRSTNTSEIEINIFTILISLFYFVVVIGFVFLIFNIEGVRLKTIEIDNKTQGKLRKFYLFIMILVAINIVYSSVKLFFDLWK